MSFASRSALAVACLVLVAGSRASAQDPVSPPDPSDDGVCCQRFHFRMPRMSLRPMRPMRFNHMERMDMGRFRMRGLERSLGRLDRMHGREFAMRDRALDRHFELRERVMDRMHDRLDRMHDLGRLDRLNRMDRFHMERPLRMHRHWRTI